MSKVQTLRVVVKQRLTAAAEEIFELFERTIAEYEEELCRHRKLLDAVFQPQVQLHRTVQTFTPVPVKSEEDEEEPQSSQLHHIKPEEIRDGEHLKTEAGVEDCGGPEPVKDSDPDRYLQPKEIDGARQLKMDVQFSRADIQQLSKRKEESDVTKFTFTPDPVKSEAGEERPQASQLHQRQTVFKIRDVERWTAERAGVDCGGPEPARNFNLQAAIEDKTPHFSESDTDDSSDWEETRQPQPGLNPLDYNEAPVSDVEDKTVKTPGSSERVTNSDHKKHLQKLVRVQTGSNPMSCPVCGKRYKRKKSLMTHIRLHAEGKTFRCSVCKESFQERRHFLEHMRTHVEERRRFSCSVCGKRFMQLPTLTRHMMIHTGEKPYGCTVCNKRFARRYVFREHKCNERS
ncbi:zinc finger and SCAN domain-containing protein 2-like isoform X2 [Acanthopagrus latus]|uniref:zinc finger and SCAN domain-containing protein 2-like isoform X2 n=1 Tax=Acanthopagrus latus TaxID=8177 RepID=UPI00187C6BE1|nr:zinc finger and SCAN domain-containing protein 2-like isoform X2 [Acanthopagrus latus]